MPTSATTKSADRPRKAQSPLTRSVSACPRSNFSLSARDMGRLYGSWAMGCTVAGEAYLRKRPASHQNLAFTPACREKRSAARLQFSLLYCSPSAASNVATCRRMLGSMGLLRYRVKVLAAAPLAAVRAKAKVISLPSLKPRKDMGYCIRGPGRRQARLNRG